MNESPANRDDVSPVAETGDPRPAPSAVACDICQCAMYDFHCRLICSNCGFQRDCSDP